VLMIEACIANAQRTDDGSPPWQGRSLNSLRTRNADINSPSCPPILPEMQPVFQSLGQILCAEQAERRPPYHENSPFYCGLPQAR
jgi:hypothetical protein